MFGKKKVKESEDRSFRSMFTESEDGLTIRLFGRLDSASSPDFQKEAVDKCRGRNTVLDLSDLAYISSAGLRTILAMDRAIGDGGRLLIVNARGVVMDVLNMSGFGDFLPRDSDGGA